MFGQIMSESAVPPRKRRRPALSCVECRRRKIKCDRNDPCTQCTMSKSASCTYKDGYPGPDHSIKPAVSDPIPVKPNGDLGGCGVTTLPFTNGISLSQDTRSLDSSTRTVPLFEGSHSNSTTLYSPSVGSTEEPQPEQNVQVLLKRVKKLEETLDTVSRGNPAPQWTSLSSIDCAGSSTSFFGSHVKISVPELRGSVSKTRLFGQSHWMSAFEHVRHGQRHRTKVCLTDEVIVQTHLNFQK